MSNHRTVLQSLLTAEQNHVPILNHTLRSLREDLFEDGEHPYAVTIQRRIEFKENELARVKANIAALEAAIAKFPEEGE